MKQILSLVALSSTLLISCGDAADAPKQAAADITQDPIYKKGFALVKESDCLTCHQVDAKAIGPSYREIAQKYEGIGSDQITAVAQKIITGGSGVWGQIPMTPHPSLSTEDATAMLQYILLLK